MSDACRKDPQVRREVIRAAKESAGRGLLLFMQQRIQGPVIASFGNFLRALRQMEPKIMPPGRARYIDKLKSSLSNGDSPVFVITNSSLSIPLWLIGLASKRDFILVKCKSSEDPTPVLSEFTGRASWDSFARALKGLGVKKIVIYGETSPDHFARAYAVLSGHFQVGIDADRVFPQPKRGVRKLRSAIRRV